MGFVDDGSGHGEVGKAEQGKGGRGDLKAAVKPGEHCMPCGYPMWLSSMRTRRRHYCTKKGYFVVLLSYNRTNDDSPYLFLLKSSIQIPIRANSHSPRHRKTASLLRPSGEQVNMEPAMESLGE